MNAQFAQAQEAFDNRLPPEYYEDPTALERAHDRAFDDSIQDGFLCVASPHQLGYTVAGMTRNYSAADAFDGENTANLLTALLQADRLFDAAIEVSREYENVKKPEEGVI